VKPPEATVTLDGKPARAGRLDGVLVGKHTVRAALDRHEAKAQDVTVENGLTARVSLELAPSPGRVVVSVNVTAKCALDGADPREVPAGRPLKLEVAQGKHTLNCTRDGFSPAESEVSVEAGRAALVSVTLREGPAQHEEASQHEEGSSVENEAQARKLRNDGDQKLVSQDLAGAIADYRKALELKPPDDVLGMIYRAMGIAFARQGNVEEGSRYYRLYLPLCRNPAEKVQLQKYLDQFEAQKRGR
jgi:tetratricopeptide (TPR) repeat protein